MRLCDPAEALGKVWHILDVLDGSPAEVSEPLPGRLRCNADQKGTHHLHSYSECRSVSIFLVTGSMMHDSCFLVITFSRLSSIRISKHITSGLVYSLFSNGPLHVIRTIRSDPVRRLCSGMDRRRFACRIGFLRPGRTRKSRYARLTSPSAPALWHHNTLHIRAADRSVSPRLAHRQTVASLRIFFGSGVSHAF